MARYDLVGLLLQRLLKVHQRLIKQHVRGYDWLNCLVLLELDCLLRNVLIMHLLVGPPVVSSYCAGHDCFATFFLLLILILVNLIIFRLLIL